jgi:hypothetical protein
MKTAFHDALLRTSRAAFDILSASARTLTMRAKIELLATSHRRIFRLSIINRKLKLDWVWLIAVAPDFAR